MRMPMTQRLYERLPDGSVHLRERIGSSPFMLVSGDIVCSNTFIITKNGLMNIHGELFRVVQPHAVSNIGYCGDTSVVVMKESPIAQVLQWWYLHLQTFQKWTFKFEKAFLVKAGIQEGQMLPWWSVTRWLAQTWITQ